MAHLINCSNWKAICFFTRRVNVCWFMNGAFGSFCSFPIFTFKRCCFFYKVVEAAKDAFEAQVFMHLTNFANAVLQNARACKCVPVRA